ncbi:MAG: thioredoxin domain-containing protein [Gammaproteobacteria bacterium]
MSKNHLSNETSPYLLQHADNPVEWYPWGPEALQKAQQENKPILLSIGYSACHWCHVMAHESFEDEHSAALMNELFINIKVDREERPDIDKIYQTAQFLLTQRTGGWPLTMFLTPGNHIPFFGGTYFPDQARHGLPAFKDLLQHIAKSYQDKPKEIAKQNQSLQDVLKNIYQSNHAPVSLDNSALKATKDLLLESFDDQHGGFGKAPKFPHPCNIEFLLRYWHLSKQLDKEDSQALHPAVYTLNRMASGGLFDHVSGGFCRYSVDDYWMIPHFEKMLYDNGPLLHLYSLAFQATDKGYFKTAATETAQWVMRDMQSPQGGYYSSLDADSEGMEGKFYAWEQQQLETLLTKQEYALVNLRFGIDRGPNFEDKYHLHEYTSIEECAQELSLDTTECINLWQQTREKLYNHRATRVAPDTDKKILTSWNALMIKGMLTASRVFRNNEYFISAQRAIQFIHADMYHNDRLFATYKDGKAHLNAYLDDYAFLLDAIIEYLQTYWDSHYLQFAVDLAEVLLAQFEDAEHGGFYFTANDHESLIQRPKVTSDEATPSGNGIAASTLLRLGYLLAEPRYLEAAERTLDYASQQIISTPIAHASLLRCSEEINNPPTIVIIRGSSDELKLWQQTCQQQFNPRRMTFAIPSNEENLHPALKSKFSNSEETLAYICQGTSCQAPVNHITQLTKALGNNSNNKN